MNRFTRRAGSGLIGMGLLAAAAFGFAPPAFALGTPAGTNISNQAIVDYTDANGNALQTPSNIVVTVVAQVSAVQVDPDRSSSATPGDTIYYAHVVTNIGNGNDTIDLTAVSSNAWVTAIYSDADSSGTFTAGDVLLGDTDGDTIPDSGVLGFDGFINILVSVLVPPLTADGTVDTTTVTGTSNFGTLDTDTALDTTTVNAPNMSVVKSVAPVGPQPPGATLTYTIVVTNNGAGNADNVVLTDALPANTNYVLGSITLNASSLTDINLDDAGDFGFTTANSVTVTIGTLPPAGVATVTFQVTIQ